VFVSTLQIKMEQQYVVCRNARYLAIDYVVSDKKDYLRHRRETFTLFSYNRGSSSRLDNSDITSRNPNSVTSILLLALFREEKAISEVLNSGFAK
jgi:hypothetical protein